MNVTFHYEDAEEERQHLNAIHALAQDLNQDENRVRVLYETELSRLQQEAKIKNFLTILAARQVVDSFRDRRLATPAAAPAEPL